ncbi:Histidine-tRNA ligase, mitochondrial [Smittium mucronatum]|uniref:Histidine--tRNA ligase, mitochondrial n=1 Tax=Smittium mucronatum TaxID=133383 RepID=A0A1R0GXF5_9FUNG|nr:Histidine-tRNA ligase, mitochondrial [Smittium mucronatum]
MADIDGIKKQIAAVGAQLRGLKANNGSEQEIEALRAQLETLKTAMRGGSAPSGSASKEVVFNLKVPKGTKDYNEKEMVIREKVINTITSTFKKYGGVPIDTPVFELKEILSGKYGEDSKLIYDLEDQGGEKCALRYDLTVPFARFVAMNKISNIKRYHVAKVYRRDQPAMTKGRMREFYQCDFDIAGQYDTMIPDAEIVCVANEVLTKLEIGEFIIKINHRKILDGIFDFCGVPEDKIRTISSAIDKLDKLPWESVFKEMTVDKGLDPLVAEKIGEIVRQKGGAELVEKLLLNQELTANQKLNEGLLEMRLFFQYAAAYEITPRISFDLSLARGLDYYTGIIYEAVLVQEENDRDSGKAKKKSGGDNDEASARIGSVAAGGRYDELVGMFNSSKSGRVPCVGISFGLERIFAILSSKLDAAHVKSTQTDVFVLSVGEGLLVERIKFTNMLRKAGIKAEFLMKNVPRLQAQYNFCDKFLIKYAVILGRSELDSGNVRIKNMVSGDSVSGDKDGDLVPIENLVSELQSRLAAN